MVSPHEGKPISVEHKADVDEENAVACASIKKFLFQQFAQAAPESPFIQAPVVREVLAQFDFVIARLFPHLVAESEQSYQEVFPRAKLRELVLGYWNDANRIAIRKAVAGQDIWQEQTYGLVL